MAHPEAAVVLVDMDGVLADFDQEVLDRMADRHPHITSVERRNFRVADDYPEHRELVRAISDEAGFFDALPVVEGALEGWQRIIDLGYWPQICSSPIRTNPHSAGEKLGWLERHFVPAFGSWVVEQAIITRDKHKYSGLALIDDRSVIEHAAQAAWQHIVFDRLYNQDSSEPRLRGWYDEHLSDLLNAAKNRVDGVN